MSSPTTHITQTWQLPHTLTRVLHAPTKLFLAIHYYFLSSPFLFDNYYIFCFGP